MSAPTKPHDDDPDREDQRHPSQRKDEGPNNPLPGEVGGPSAGSSGHKPGDSPIEHDAGRDDRRDDAPKPPPR